MNKAWPFLQDQIFAEAARRRGLIGNSVILNSISVSAGLRKALEKEFGGAPWMQYVHTSSQNEEWEVGHIDFQTSQSEDVQDVEFD